MELYPTKRAIIRFDAGDAMVFHRDTLQTVPFDVGILTLTFTTPGRLKHGLQVGAGFSFRF